MISIVIPCHNEEAVLPQVYTRLTAVASAWDEDYEVLLVDDGSTDATWSRIQACHRRDARWKGLRLARNFGQQAALGAGLRHAQGEAVACLDADLQDPPELLSQFLELWRAGAEVVYGIRAERPESWWKRLCYRAFYWLLVRTATVPLPADAGDFALLDRKVVKAMRRCREQRPFWRGLRAFVGFRQVGVPYSRHSRQAGQAQYTLAKLLALANDGIWSLSTLPLRLCTAAALALVLASLSFAWLRPEASLVPVLAAGNLLGLMLLGQYTARILDEVRGRPRWIIADRVGLLPPRRRSVQQPKKRLRVRQVREQEVGPMVG